MPQQAPPEPQYQQATALEALLGWLHLSGRHDRVEQLFAVMMEEE